MSSDEHEKFDANKRELGNSRVSLDLYFYEQVGSRHYLRITPFAIVLMLIALAIGFTILWMDARKQSIPNVNLEVPSATPYSPQGTIIRQLLPPSPAKAVKQPKAALPSTLPSPVKNTNAP